MKSKKMRTRSSTKKVASANPVKTKVIKVERKKKDHALPAEFDLKQASAASSTLLTQAQISRANSIFQDEAVRINMDIVAFKIPDGHGHFANINLPHSPYPADPEILFIIPDDKINETEPEHLVNRMKDKLREFNISYIREVMTVKQVKGDFSTFEAKRQLAKRIDVVIGMKSIFKLLPTILGREFYKRKKALLELELHDEDQWDEEFEGALKRTVLNISLNGHTSTVLVGHTNLTVRQITDNASKIINWLMRMFPGLWKNISQLSLTMPGLAGVPPLLIYVGTGSRKDVAKAVTKGRKVTEAVVGDLSTLLGGHVKVHPFGDIEVLNDPDQSDVDDELNDDNDSDEDEGSSKPTAKPVVEKSNEKDRKKKEKAKKSEADMNDAEKKYVESVFKRQEFEDSQKKKKKRESPSKPEESKSKPAKKKRKTKAK
jgi:hypothetical protein